MQPKKLAFIGFGEGWLYQQPEGAPGANHSVRTVLGAEDLVFEDDVAYARRFVYAENGRRYFRTLIADTAINSGAGMINWDTGSAFDSGETAFMFSTARVTMQPQDVFKVIQVKQDRIGAYSNLNGSSANSAYVAQTPGALAMTVKTYEGAVDVGGYYANTTGVMNDGAMTSFGWIWKLNTPDQNDGHIAFMAAKNGHCTLAIPSYSGTPNLPSGIIRSNAPERPRFMKWQDYIGNNTGNSLGQNPDTNPARNIEILRTDLFMQRGGSLFFIADHPDPALCTTFTPLIPKAFNGPNSWTFRLWKGHLKDYSTVAVFMLDENLNRIVGCWVGK